MSDASIQIANQIGALAVRVDARDWAGLEKLFEAQVRVDYSALFGGKPQMSSGEDLVRSWRQLLPGFTHTSHLIGAPCINIEGERARTLASVTAWHVINDTQVAGGSVWIVHGCYEIGFMQREGIWRIAELTLARAWTEGNEALPEVARERAARIRQV
jgi:hypothetical protein